MEKNTVEDLSRGNMVLECVHTRWSSEPPDVRTVFRSAPSFSSFSTVTRHTHTHNILIAYKPKMTVLPAYTLDTLFFFLDKFIFLTLFSFSHTKPIKHGDPTVYGLWTPGHHTFDLVPPICYYINLHSSGKSFHWMLDHGYRDLSIQPHEH